MKGLSQTIYIVVAAVVILVTALVILAILGVFLPNVTGFGDAKNLCLTSATISCSAGGVWPPPMWNSPSLRLNGVSKSCNQVMLEGSFSCGDCAAVAKGCNTPAG